MADPQSSLPPVVPSTPNLPAPLSLVAFAACGCLHTAISGRDRTTAYMLGRRKRLEKRGLTVRDMTAVEVRALVLDCPEHAALRARLEREGKR